MATIRIQFPERDQPSVLVLRGRRITVGRTANNTIQILDRTLSGRHAELFEEDGHYRVHDAGSSNGVFVNGNLISDFHLHEACKLTFGSVECDFDPQGTGGEADEEALPTQADLTDLRSQNAEMSRKLEILQDELSSLHLLRPSEGEDAALVIPQSEHEKVAVELANSKEQQLRTEQKVTALHEELAVTLRDNENLQRALDVLKAALDKASPFSASTPIVATSASAGPIPAKPAASPAASGVSAIPKPALAPSASFTPKAPSAPTPAVPAPKLNVPAAAPFKSPAAAPVATPRPPGALSAPTAPGLAPKPALPVAAAPKLNLPGLKVGPPGMISSGPPKPTGLPVPMAKPSIPSAGLPKPVLKPSVAPSPNVGPQMPSKTTTQATGDGTKTQKLGA